MQQFQLLFEKKKFFKVLCFSKSRWNSYFFNASWLGYEQCCQIWQVSSQLGCFCLDCEGKNVLGQGNKFWACLPLPNACAVTVYQARYIVILYALEVSITHYQVKRQIIYHCVEGWCILCCLICHIVHKCEQLIVVILIANATRWCITVKCRI